METTIKIVDFDISKALMVIEMDDDLTEMFRDKYNTSFNMCHFMIKEGTLKKSAQEYIKSLFDKIIINRKEYITLYNRIDTNIPNIVIESSEEEIVEEKQLPRRYGKRYILKDIQEQDGKATDIQRAMLKVNDLKNIYVKLERLGITNMFGDANTLSDKDAREIIAVIETVEKKLSNVIKTNNTRK